MIAEQQARFRLAISAEDYQGYYQGLVQDVIVQAQDGRRIQFPASALRPFVSHQGVNGLFELRFDAQQKFKQLIRIAN